MIPLFEARDVHKAFGPTAVLRGVSLKIDAGEIVSIIGENGAGKSTFAKILAGIHAPDRGTLFKDGEPIVFKSPSHAIESGIAIVHQELNLAENLTVMQNIMLGREETRRGFLTSGPRAQHAAGILHDLAPEISADAVVETLSAAERQLVEIARALSFSPRLLIFDEPTSSLSEREGDHLLTVIEALRTKGVSIVYVSHRLSEVLRISDRVIALRDGEFSGTADRNSATREILIQLMIGRELKELYPYESRVAGQVRLEVENLVPTAAHAPCSFSIKAGEIVAISGLIGSGRSEVLEAIFGVRNAPGTVRINGVQALIRTPEDALRYGLAFVPESRKEQGLFLDGSILENIIASSISKTSALFRRRREEIQCADNAISRLAIRCRGSEQLAKDLSGGNQQKVVIGKCLASAPSILLLDEPTRGVDIGARRDIYAILFRLAKSGCSILFVSSELEEVIGIADRAIVFSQGKIQGELARAEFSEHALMSLASSSLARAA